MPIYEYECEKCGAVFEARRSIEDKEEVKCPVCGEKECRRVFSVFSNPLFSRGSCGPRFT